MTLDTKTWTLTGEVDIKDIRLNNPTIRVKTVVYNVDTQMADVEVIATEGDGIFKHSRTFQFEVTGDLLTAINTAGEDFVNAAFGVKKK